MSEPRLKEGTAANDLPSSEDDLPSSEELSLTDSALFESGHELEQEIQRLLLADDDLDFSSLAIHRTPNGICLEGVVEVEGDCPDICNLVQQVSGVNEVLNHLVVHRNHQPPAKG